MAVLLKTVSAQVQDASLQLQEYISEYSLLKINDHITFLFFPVFIRDGGVDCFKNRIHAITACFISSLSNYSPKKLLNFKLEEMSCRYNGIFSVVQYLSLSQSLLHGGGVVFQFEVQIETKL